MNDDLYASLEEIESIKTLAKPLGKAWVAEITHAMRGDRLRRSHYERLHEVLEKATAALRGRA